MELNWFYLNIASKYLTICFLELIWTQLKIIMAFFKIELKMGNQWNTSGLQQRAICLISRTPRPYLLLAIICMCVCVLACVFIAQSWQQLLVFEGCKQTGFCSTAWRSYSHMHMQIMTTTTDTHPVQIYCTGCVSTGCVRHICCDSSSNTVVRHAL